MSGREGLSTDVACPVPECKDGYVRVPIVVERVSYGHGERYADFTEYPCNECGGLGIVPRNTPGHSGVTS